MHKRVDVFGNDCATIIGLNVVDKPIIKVDSVRTELSATSDIYKNLNEVLEHYAECSDGNFRILLRVNLSLSEDKPENLIYLLHLNSCNLNVLFEILKNEYTNSYKVLTLNDLDSNSIVYCQETFMNRLSLSFFGFNCIREDKIHTIQYKSDGSKYLCITPTSIS